jgi:hypothetical protein
MGNELVAINTPPQWISGLAGSLQEAMPVAEMLAKSDFVPKQYQGKPANIIIAVEMGRSVGLSPIAALHGIAVVNGKPSLFGDHFVGIVQNNPDYAGETTKWITPTHCKVTVQKTVKGTVQEYSGEFSEADAKRAGLWTKQGPWSSNPVRMLEVRARAFAYRNGFAGALCGLYHQQEAEDMREVDATVIDDKPRGRKPRIVAPAVTDAAAPAHIVDAVVERVEPQTECIVPPTQPAIEEVIDADREALEDFRKVLSGAAKKWGRKRLDPILLQVCGMEIVKADDVPAEHRQAVIEQICSLEA